MRQRNKNEKIFSSILIPYRKTACKYDQYNFFIEFYLRADKINPSLLESFVHFKCLYF